MLEPESHRTIFFWENTNKLEWNNVVTGTAVEEKWEALKDIIHKTMVKEASTVKRRLVGSKDWWDRGCTKKKRAVHKMYKNWRNGMCSREKYIEEKRKLTVYLEKMKKWKEKEKMELRMLRNEAEVWRFINKKRGKRVWVENEINKERWEKHFRNLLGGAPCIKGEDGDRVEVRKKREQMEESMVNAEKGKQEELGEDEIAAAVRRMKKKKAAGIDGIPMEAWLYGGQSGTKRSSGCPETDMKRREGT